MSAHSPAAVSGDCATVTPERIGELTTELAGILGHSVSEISHLNSEARLLSLNAQLEAARAGVMGMAFGVVADAMTKLSVRTAEIAKSMSKNTQAVIGELRQVNELLSTNTRGMRLSDLALTNIELIDRNLYERSCDVRWWATDSSLVDALTEQTPAALQHASSRMGVILNSYTVYFDLVLCGVDGVVVANGRPGQFRSVGSNHSGSDWFQSAMATTTGEQFGFESVHRSTLVNDQFALVYSCVVRRDGKVDGEPLGVLGIVFNWSALGQTIVENVPLSAEEKPRSRACIVDNNGHVLADSAGQQLRDQFQGTITASLFSEAKNFSIEDLAGRRQCIGHAKAPGFETYSTGWHALVMVELEK